MGQCVARGLRRTEREQCLTDRSGLGAASTTDTRRHCGGEASADLLHVDHIGPVEDAEVNHESGDSVELMEKGHGCSVEAVLMNRERSQFDEAHTEFVVTAVATQPTHRDKTFEHAVGRRAGKARAPNDLSEHQPAGTVEGVENQRDAIENCCRGRIGA